MTQLQNCFLKKDSYVLLPEMIDVFKVFSSAYLVLEDFLKVTYFIYSLGSFDPFGGGKVVSCRLQTPFDLRRIPSPSSALGSFQRCLCPNFGLWLCRGRMEVAPELSVFHLPALSCWQTAVFFRIFLAGWFGAEALHGSAVCPRAQQPFLGPLSVKRGQEDC